MTPPSSRAREIWTRIVAARNRNDGSYGLLDEIKEIDKALAEARDEAVKENTAAKSSRIQELESAAKVLVEENARLRAEIAKDCGHDDLIRRLADALEACHTQLHLAERYIGYGNKGPLSEPSCQLALKKAREALKAAGV